MGDGGPTRARTWDQPIMSRPLSPPELWAPKSSQIVAHGTFPRRSFVRSVFAAGLAFAASAAALADDIPPIVIPKNEIVTVRRLLVDVSVIDPRGSAWASVPGIPADAFELRLDGKLLPPERAARVEFDEVCETDASANDQSLVEAAPTLLLFVDLNFLDARMRAEAATALDDLAERMVRTRLNVKATAFGRRIVPLTHDFVSDPQGVRDAARRLRDLDTPSLPPNPDSAIPDPEDPTRPSSSIPLTDPDSGNSQRESDPFSIQSRGPFAELQRNALPNRAVSDMLARPVDSRSTLAALESVLLSHQHLRGRKALVLFTSAWFDLPEETWLSQTRGVRDAAAGGFTLWAVEARTFQLGQRGSQESDLLEYLTNASGGDTVRAVGSVVAVFERALAQLSCYYLFSIPMDAPAKSREYHSIDVRLDTGKYPQYWPYRIRTINQVALSDDATLRTSKRLAALIEPGAYRSPEVRLSASYPGGNKTLVTTIETAVMLPDLSFQPSGDQGYVARFGWEGLVTDDVGRTYCKLGDGAERAVRSEQPPTRFPPSLLMLQSQCKLPGPGRYDIRVVVEDLTTGDIGASTATLTVSRATRKSSEIGALRLGRNSGRDFLLEPAGGKSAIVPRDAQRTGFIPLRADETLDPQDRLLVRFVACGPSQAIPRAVVYTPGDQPAALFQIALQQRGAQTTEEATCREYEGLVPEASLTPGDYAVAVIGPASGISNRVELNDALAAKRARATIGFRVGPPALTPPPPKDRSAWLKKFAPASSS